MIVPVSAMIPKLMTRELQSMATYSKCVPVDIICLRDGTVAFGNHYLRLSIVHARDQNNNLSEHMWMFLGGWQKLDVFEGKN